MQVIIILSKEELAWVKNYEVTDPPQKNLYWKVISSSNQGKEKRGKRVWAQGQGLESKKEPPGNVVC